MASKLQPEPDDAVAAGMTETADTMLGLTLRRFLNHKIAVAGASVLVIVALSAIFAPLIAPFGITQYDYGHMFSPPSALHLMGTDDTGADEFSRLLFGGRISLLVGLGSMVIAVGIGTVLGSVAGFFGGWIDTIIMRFVDVALSIPQLFVLLILAVVVPPKLEWIIIIIGITNWMRPTRIVRASFIQLREQEFVEAARALGMPTPRLIFRELLPNAMGPLIVNATLMVGRAIITGAVLSWLGMGIQPPTPSWGNMLNGAQSYIFQAPWLAIFPGLVILITVLSINLMGDGLRDALDPKLRQ